MLAERYTARRVYKCPNCGKRVGLRAGDWRVYFAHAIGAANDECELYASSKVAYTGRRYKEVAGPDSKSFLHSSHLAFGFGSRGPQLALFLPPTVEDPWSGALRITAHRQSRTIRFQHLQKGQSFVFPLVDGRWTVSPVGDVSEQYLARIDIGPQVLAEGQNLFDGSRDMGKQILPGEAIGAGEVVWWVSRSEISVPAEMRDLVSLRYEAEVAGWFVHRIILAATLDAGRERHALATWIQRPIRPTRARVWIEEPWPRAHSALGISIFNLTDGIIWIRTDHDSDVTLRSVETGDVVLNTEAVREARWQNVQPGYWELIVNGYVHELFQVSAEKIHTPHNIAVQIDGAPTNDLIHTAAILRDIFQSSRPSFQLDLAWGEDAVSDLIFFNGKLLQLRDGHIGSVLFRPGCTLDIDNLGAAFWPAAAQDKAISPRVDSELRARAMWLLSVVSSPYLSAGERIRLPERWRQDAMLSRLLSASWPNRFVAQLRTLQRLLEIAS